MSLVSRGVISAPGTEAAYVDFLVELRGFEPLTTAEQAHARGDSAAASNG